MLVDISNNLRVHNTNVNNNNNKLRLLNIVPSSNANTSSKGRKRISETKNNVLLSHPNYNHSHLYENEFDCMFPFFTPRNLTNGKRCQDNIDFTNCVTFPKNPIKKYSQPVSVNSHESNMSCVSTSSSLKNSMFGPLGKNGEIDPINHCFVHLPVEKRLKFGYLELEVNEFGKYKIKELPRDVIGDIDNEDDLLEILDAQIEDLNISQQPQQLKSLNINEQNPFLRNGTAYQYGPRSPKRRGPSLLNPIATSPIRKLANEDNIDTLRYTISSPIKPSLIVKTLKNTPKKLVKPKTNYSKWDKSMTIGAKAIMKMVDDSLVSSDTEMYNLSQSFIYKSSQDRQEISINADELNDALMGPDIIGLESPLTCKMRELKI